MVDRAGDVSHFLDADETQIHDVWMKENHQIEDRLTPSQRQSIENWVGCSQALQTKNSHPYTCTKISVCKCGIKVKYQFV